MTESRENIFVRIYRNRIGPPGRPAEAYGYWIVILGVFIALFGGVAMLAAETLPLTATQFDIALVGGATALAIGPVLALLGMVVRLPLQPVATAIAGVGATVAVGSVTFVIVVVPLPLAVTDLIYPSAGYLAGVGLIMLAATVIPLRTDAYVERDPTAVGHPFYELRETDEGWIWHLYDRDGTTVATSPRTFPDRSAARAALERMSVQAPMAGIELTAGE